MKSSLLSIRSKIISKNSLEARNLYEAKSTNINVLLNRVKIDQKKESRKKLLFTAATSFCVVLFGVLIF